MKSIDFENCSKCDVQERIDLFLAHEGLNRSRFEKMSGLSNGYVRNMRESIGAKKLEQILTAFPNLSRVWLLTGEGEMLVNSPVHHNKITFDLSGESTTEYDNSTSKAGDNGVAVSGHGTYSSGDAAEIKRLEAENESLKAQLKEKDAQIASLHTILANITNK